MPTGEGWFIDVTTGRALSVREHETAVRANPRRFRIRQDETQGKSRDELLSLVFGRGFVRVRWDKSGVVFEFDGRRGKALRLIRKFLVEHGAGPLTTVRISDLADSRFRERGCWQELKSGLMAPGSCSVNATSG